MKRLRSMIGGSQQLFIPIAPKPAPTAIPAHIGVATASSKNTVTSVATPTNHQLSGNFGNHLMSNLPVLDLSSSIVVAQTKSTPPVQNSGNNVTQGTTSLNESTLAVSSFWNSIAQGPSPASVSRTESRPVVYSSVNMVTQSQLPVPSTVVSQISSTPLLSIQNASLEFAPLTDDEVERMLRVISGDTYGNLDTNENRNTIMTFQTIDEDMDWLWEPDLVSSTNATPPPNTASNTWVESPGLTTANASEIVQREQYVDSTANSSNVQVLYIRCLYTVLFSICFWCH